MMAQGEQPTTVYETIQADDENPHVYLNQEKAGTLLYMAITKHMDFFINSITCFLWVEI